MSAIPAGARLSSITTMWSVVLDAHDAEPQVAQAAQRRLLDRYGGSIKRYLLKATRDEDSADELYHEFVLRFLRGDYRKASPQRGSFRGYVKTVLAHLIVRHHKQKKAGEFRQMGPEVPEPAVEQSMSLAEDRDFLDSWRSELTARCWAALARDEEAGGQPYFTILQFRSAHPTMPSAEMAEALAAKFGRPLTAVGVRQSLHRARLAFARLLVEEVMQSLVDPTDEQLDQELIVLGLFEHCRPVLEERRRPR